MIYNNSVFLKKMDLIIYFLGSLYIISALFRFSYSYSKLFLKKYKKIDLSQFEKIDEIIYSSIHSVFILLLSGYSLQNNIFALDFHTQNHSITHESIKFTLALSLSYFSLDLIKCILKLNSIFILHHLCAIHLLLLSTNSLYENIHEGSFVMAYLFLLECNTPLMNLGILLKMLKFDYNIYGSVWILHLLSYTICRLIMIPYITYYYYYHNGINYYQIPSLMIIYGGSCFWAYKQLYGIQKKVILHI